MKILGFEFPPPPPKLEGYTKCPNCLEEIVRTKSLVCVKCGYTLRIPLSGWIGALLLVLSLPVLFLWVMGVRPQINVIPLIGGLLPTLPPDILMWIGLLFLFLGGVVAFAAASRIHAEAARSPVA